MYPVWRLVFDELSGWVWEPGNTQDTEPEARGEALWWLQNGPAPGAPGHIAHAGYWSWSGLAGRWLWESVG